MDIAKEWYDSTSNSSCASLIQLNISLSYFRLPDYDTPSIQHPPHLQRLHHLFPLHLSRPLHKPFLHRKIRHRQTLQRNHPHPSLRPLHQPPLIPIHHPPHLPKPHPITMHQRTQHPIHPRIHILICHPRRIRARIVLLSTTQVEDMVAQELVELGRR